MPGRINGVGKRHNILAASRAYHPRIQLVQADKYASVQLEGSVEDSAKVKMRTATAERIQSVGQ